VSDTEIVCNKPPSAHVFQKVLRARSIVEPASIYIVLLLIVDSGSSSSNDEAINYDCSCSTFFMLANMILPRLMPSTTDVKLSSSNSDAASRETSEPVIAIAMPISAGRSAGLLSR
jgi:hypothetical protein